MTVEDIYRHFQNFYVIIDDNENNLYTGRLNSTPVEILYYIVYSVDIVTIHNGKDPVLLINVYKQSEREV